MSLFDIVSLEEQLKELEKETVKEEFWQKLPSETGKILSLDVVGSTELIKGSNILIVDDICSKGGTFYFSAKKLKELGAKNIYLYMMI